MSLRNDLHLPAQLTYSLYVHELDTGQLGKEKCIWECTTFLRSSSRRSGQVLQKRFKLAILKAAKQTEKGEGGSKVWHVRIVDPLLWNRCKKVNKSISTKSCYDISTVHQSTWRRQLLAENWGCHVDNNVIIEAIAITCVCICSRVPLDSVPNGSKHENGRDMTLLNVQVDVCKAFSHTHKLWHLCETWHTKGHGECVYVCKWPLSLSLSHSLSMIIKPGGHD